MKGNDKTHAWTPEDWPAALPELPEADKELTRRSAAWQCRTPETAPAATLDEARRSVRRITAQREQTARRIATKLGLAVPAAGGE